MRRTIVGLVFRYQSGYAVLNGRVPIGWLGQNPPRESRHTHILSDLNAKSKSVIYLSLRCAGEKISTEMVVCVRRKCRLYRYSATSLTEALYRRTYHQLYDQRMDIHYFVSHFLATWQRFCGVWLISFFTSLGGCGSCFALSRPRFDASRFLSDTLRSTEIRFVGHVN